MSSVDEPESGKASQRSCAGCTMCCKLLSIEVLDKPRLKWCRHCDIGVGCKIYEERPTDCRVFNCGYLTQPHIGEHWKPASSKMVVALATNANRLIVYVDLDRSDAWRKEPFYSDVKSWARAAAQNGGQVLISQGHDMIVVMPDGETNLGRVGDDQLIITRRKKGAGEVGFDHIVVDKDDPVLTDIQLLQDKQAAGRVAPEKLADAKRRVDAWLARRTT